MAYYRKSLFNYTIQGAIYDKQNSSTITTCLQERAVKVPEIRSQPVLRLAVRQDESNIALFLYSFYKEAETVQKEQWWDIEEYGEKPRRKVFLDVVKDGPAIVFSGFIVGVLLITWAMIHYAE